MSRNSERESPTNAFDLALGFTLRWEGGYVNDPDDPGGATNKGVTQDTYDAYRDRARLPRRSVRYISDSEVRDIYREYWAAVRASELPPLVAEVMFDFGVNAGPGRAVRLLQSVLGVAIDGKLGPKTMTAAWERPGLASSLLDARIGYYVGLVAANPRLQKFLNGWVRRVEDQRKTLGLRSTNGEAD